MAGQPDSRDEAMGPPVAVEGEGRGGAAVLVCEHASPLIPASYEGLGLAPETRRSHAAWDPGALSLARAMAERLDAPLVHGGWSRLVHDLNRPPASPEAMPARVERYEVPGNRGLDEAARQARAAACYHPFHDRLRRLLDARTSAGRPSVVVTVHSFTPEWMGRPREVEIGVLHDADARLADRLLAALAAAAPERAVARNAPYGPEDGVTHTLAVHALPRGLPNVMLEVRNDLLGDAAAVEAMARLLAGALGEAVGEIAVAGDVTGSGAGAGSGAGSGAGGSALAGGAQGRTNRSGGSA